MYSQLFRFFGKSHNKQDNVQSAGHYCEINQKSDLLNITVPFS